MREIARPDPLSVGLRRGYMARRFERARMASCALAWEVEGMTPGDVDCTNEIMRFVIARALPAGRS